MKLARIGFARYRSVGDEPALIDLRKRLTVVVGANNSGKSNVLTGLLALRQNNGSLPASSPMDRHLRDNRLSPHVIADLELEGGDTFPGKSHGDILRFVREVDGSEVRWVETPFPSMEFDAFNRYFRRLRNRYFTGVPSPQELANAHAEVAQHLWQPAIAAMPSVVFIPQHRQVTTGAAYSIDGAGIVDLLASWQHPEIGADADVEKFLKVQTLLRALLHLPSVDLEVSHDKRTILVKRDGLRLPLQSYGTGIHQLIVLAVAVLSHSRALLCLEEPETNLHPTLQREFLRFLLSDTDNQYLISTHSHALIEPTPKTDILHVSLQGHVTVPRLIQTPTDALGILRDLGVRASDLLQANAVIWVEGPSDRIYLNKWLSLIAPDLVETIHYSVMFYGGRLLSHLSLERDAADAAAELIRLLRINQHAAIVIDSDRRSPRSHLNETKRRIAQEAADQGVYCWITDGREIENYLSSEAISAVYRSLTLDSSLTITLGRFDSLEDQLRSAMGSRWRAKLSYNDAKPLRARDIVAETTNAQLGASLRGHVHALVAMIRRASELYHGDA